MRTDQQEILTAYRSVGKLTVHILEPVDIRELSATSYPKGLSPPDITVLYIAEKLDALLLSSDGSVRKFAPNRGIKTHGMFWILDQLIDQELLTKPRAVILIKKLFDKNIMYKNNSKLWKEAEKRIKTWS